MILVFFSQILGAGLDLVGEDYAHVKGGFDFVKNKMNSSQITIWRDQNK